MGESSPALKPAIPVRYAVLPNGLKVVLSEERSLPLIQVGVYYGIGDRLESEGSAGFAHLCEHMMFQGSERISRGEHTRSIEAVGGVLNASTRDDFTSYYQTVPAAALDTVLSLEAERMQNLRLTVANLANQREVVKEEGIGLVKNRPYVGLLYVYLRRKAFDNYHNGHDSVSDFSDIDVATVDSIERFYRTYYAPNNAVLTLVGDIDTDATLAMVHRHFGSIPTRRLLPRINAGEEPQKSERRFLYSDPLAENAAVVIGYRMPSRRSGAYWPLILLAEALLVGEESALRTALVNGGAALQLKGGINFPNGTAFDTNGATLLTILAVAAADIDSEHLAQKLDVAMAAALQRLDEQTLIAAFRRFKLRFYRSLEEGYRLQLLSLLALFDDEPDQINQLLTQLAAVSLESLRAAAKRYLVPANRTLVLVSPGRPRAARSEQAGRP